MKICGVHRGPVMLHEFHGSTDDYFVRIRTTVDASYLYLFSVFLLRAWASTSKDGRLQTKDRASSISMRHPISTAKMAVFAVI